MPNVLRSIAVIACMARGFAQSGGGIQGVISDESGQGLIGAYVIASPVKPGTTLTAVSTTSGQYNFVQVPAGKYTICVQVPPSNSRQVGPGAKPPVNYLDTCYWSSSPTQVTVVAGQVAANTNVRVAKGGVVHVRVNDPGKYMATGAGVVLVGVLGPSSRFIPLRVTSNDLSGRTLELTIPFSTALRLEVNGGGLQLADGNGAALAAITSSFPILQAVGQKEQFLTFNITGKRP